MQREKLEALLVVIGLYAVLLMLVGLILWAAI